MFAQEGLLPVDTPGDYYLTLRDLGFRPFVRHLWACVNEPARVQGWKLHISSMPSEAHRLLAIVAPLLNSTGVAFKCAKNASVLSQLNEGLLSGGAVGKFLTIYPPSDDAAVRLGQLLAAATTGLRGPQVVTDLRLGDVVYARYGTFRPAGVPNRIGSTSRMLSAPDGSLFPDSYKVPFTVPSGIDNPFNSVPGADGEDGTNPLRDRKNPEARFGPGYLLIKAVRRQAKGSVFWAIDLRNHALALPCVIKEGRQHCLSDKFGRDIRTRLRHQEALSTVLAPVVPIPKVSQYFEVDGNGYLPFEFIQGMTLASIVSPCWNSQALDARIKLIRHLVDVLHAVSRLHSTGYVHRDLTVFNIWLATTGQIYLLDLELAHNPSNSDFSPFQGGTPGFVSPQQKAGRDPEFADDIYTLGANMIYLFTDIDPRKILFVNEENRKSQLTALIQDIPEEIVETITNCVSVRSTVRPSLEELITRFEQFLLLLSSSGGRATGRSRKVLALPPILTEQAPGSIDAIVRSGIHGLLTDVLLDKDTGLWLSPTGRAATTLGTYEVLRDAYKGVAGVVYLLSLASRFGYRNRLIEERVCRAVRWLLDNQSSQDDRLPGLHFGESGIAVALAEGISAGLIVRTAPIEEYLFRALSGRLDWPDLILGAAGQGVAALRCGDLLRDPRLTRLSDRCADYLVRSQKRDGCWEMPPGIPSESGKTYTGFAHGVSGILYFLGEYANRSGSGEVWAACQSAIEWLIRNARQSEDGLSLQWDVSPRDSRSWTWWCHGSPGIAMTFLRLFELTGNSQYAVIAHKALQHHPADLTLSNLCLCHGLSGLGEIYLEGARILGDQELKDRAVRIADIIYHLGRKKDSETMVWLAEDPYFSTADLMIGSGGIVHFFLKLMRNSEVGFPLQLDPVPR